MTRFVITRLIIAVGQLLVAAVVIFFLLRLLPLDPISRIVGLNPTPAAQLQARRSLGLDRGIWSQFGTYLDQLVHGSLGVSWTTGNSVRHEILESLPVTLQFVVPGFIVALVVGIPLGILTATRAGGLSDKVVTGYSLFAGAQPDFWWALMFLFLFFFVIPIFPAPLGVLSPAITPPPDVTHFVTVDALLSGDTAAFTSAVSHFALPILTLAFVISGPILKMTRQSAASTLESEFVLYSRACGLPRKRIRRAVLALSIMPVLTITGILFGFMLGGAVLIETVFALNGLGRYALDRTTKLDFPAVQGAVIVLTACALVIYLIVDIAHAAIDGRVSSR